jgi:ATP-binding cassette, subfamily F, member 3
VLRGDRIAVIGLNGAGKTTLLRLLAGEVAPDAGTVQLGHNVRLGYFAQHHTDQLDASRTVLEEVARLVPDRPPSWVRGVLGAFLFSGDDVDKRIGVLSGGERARVSLAKLLVVPSNFLLMDEPTNHLDLESSEALIDALTGYEGTLLFVSHNRSFVNGLATQVWEVKEGAVDAQPGDLDDWHRRRAQAPQVAAPVPQPERTGGQGKDARRERALQREKRLRALGPLLEEIARLEQRIAELEREKKAAEAQLADPGVFADAARSTSLVTAYRDAQRKVEELYGRWEERQEELQQAEARLGQG